MKLINCEYNGRTFAAASDGQRVYEAAPDILSLIRLLDGKEPTAELLSGDGIAIGDVRIPTFCFCTVVGVVHAKADYVLHRFRDRR